MRRIRPRLSYANVVASLALFLALSTGTAYAVNEWTGANIVDNSLTGADIREPTLAKVPSADTLDGIDSIGFIRGGSAASCCFDPSRGKAFFNRVLTGSDGIESTFLVLPTMFKLTGQCSTSDARYAELQIYPLGSNVDFWYERSDGVASHAGVIPSNGTIQAFSVGTIRITIQAGVGQGSQAGQRLATVTVFQGVRGDGCFFQASALTQAT
jgi:hypothetical protein